MSMRRFSSALISLTFLLPWTGEVVSGWSYFNQPCTPYQDQYNSCDPYAFLSCERTEARRPNDFVCKCTSPEYVWSSLVGRCTLRVGASCFMGPVGRGIASSKYPECPPSSSCDIRGSYTCKCHEHHIPNSDGSACSKGTSTLRHKWKDTFLLTLLPFFVMPLLSRYSLY